MLIWSIQSNIRNHEIRASMISTIRHWFVERGKFHVNYKMVHNFRKKVVKGAAMPACDSAIRFFTIFRYFPQLFLSRIRKQMADATGKPGACLNTGKPVEVVGGATFILDGGSCCSCLKESDINFWYLWFLCFQTRYHLQHHPRHTASDPLTGCFARSTGSCKWEVVWHRFVYLTLFTDKIGRSRLLISHELLGLFSDHPWCHRSEMVN